jgi:hypothetical protein
MFTFRRMHPEGFQRPLSAGLNHRVLIEDPTNSAWVEALTSHDEADPRGGNTIISWFEFFPGNLIRQAIHVSYICVYCHCSENELTRKWTEVSSISLASRSYTSREREAYHY